MLQRIGLVLCVGVLAGVSSAQGAIVNWVGSGTNVNVDDPNNWSTLTVPGPGDDANLYVSTADANWIYIPAGATFDPNGFLRYGHGSTNRKLTVLKSLTLYGGLQLSFTTTSGANTSDQVRLGEAGTQITLNLMGNSPFDLNQGTATGWGSLNAVNVVFNLAGDDILLPTLSRTATSAVPQGAMAGGSGTAEANDTSKPIMNFTRVGGTIRLEHAGNRSGGTLGLGNVQMAVRSDQTWVCDPNGFVLRSYQHGSAGPGPFVIKSIDGGALNNLDQLNVVLSGNDSISTNEANAMQLAGGEYGSLNWTGGITSFRSNHLKLTGDVTFKGYAVLPGDRPAGRDATRSDLYGLIIRGMDSSTGSYKYLLLNGQTLTVVHGLLLDDARAAHDSTSGLPITRIDAAGAVISLGGDLRYNSRNFGAHAVTLDGDTDGTPNSHTRGIGINGGSSGATLTIGGSFSTNVRSMNSGHNLRYSTVKMLGGTAGSPVSLEVADDANATGLQSYSHSIGRLDIGAAGDAAHVRLVNEYLNDNCRYLGIGDDPNVGKTGEKLIVGTLNVLAGSTLDLNGQVVEVGSTSLSISSDSWLDLNTGLALADGNVVLSFCGLTDQTTTWAGFQDRVTDSSNPGLTFVPLYVSAEGRTYWQAVPEPGTLALLGAGLLGVLLRRRR